ncbi:hypothetical protein BC936DRAFT_142339 [Jimgerdemannia flammicorona]|uniref:Arrestin-like N-terminal domain-containing protein n=1 Tax=Jimgerdemannia flammicorona TaxID=994334 RepID=A0A433A0Q6_9FUNG|nr:hypothetical protein BC936DRAFT_142339 [Jimgerdemannia flammicorona]
MTRTLSPPKPHVDLVLSTPIVHLIGPANDDNPNRSRSILHGHVKFLDHKTKWQRITLSFHGRAVLTHDSMGNGGSASMDDAFAEHSQFLEICDIDKELIIFGGEDTIEFGLHLPFDLPPTIRTKYGFVEYTLIAKFSAGSFKSARLQKEVVVKRHYLPNAMVLVPTNEISGCRNWFEWVMEMPKAATFEQGEIVIGAKWSCEKERVEVKSVETRLEQTETIRFKVKNTTTSVRLPSKLYPITTYIPPTFTDELDTHFLRTPILPNLTFPHIFTPLIEIGHILHITFKFTNGAEDLVMSYPVILTDLPDVQANIVVGGGDDAVPVDLGLPEYSGELPRYGDLMTPGASRQTVA